MATKQFRPQLSFWERADIPFVHLSTYASLAYHAITGLFRGKASSKGYGPYILTNVARTWNCRTSDLQKQYLKGPTSETYATIVENHGQQPETVALPHDAEGLWLGNKNAKKVLVYYHGGGFVIPALDSHFAFLLETVRALNEDGHDMAIFFLRYTLTPHGRYPTQLRQAVEALRYITNETGRSPADVVIGGDSAGGNLASATLLHLSHPHPEIDPLTLSAPLAGLLAYAPWVDFSTDWPSMRDNLWKDLITPELLVHWANIYRGDRAVDNWNEPSNAPTEWWKDVKTEQILILAASDEILLSPIEKFAEKIKSVFPQTTYIVGQDESHDAPFMALKDQPTETGTELRRWLAARL